MIPLKINKFNQMKIILKLLFVLAFCIFIAIPSNSEDLKEGYKIVVKIKNSVDSMLILGHYYGEYQYVDDTARYEKDGTYVFTGDKDLPAGVYFIVLQNKKHFEFVINKEQFFSIESDTTELLKNMKFKNSPENTRFYEYLNYVAVFQKDIEPYQEGYKRSKENDINDSINFFKEKISFIDEKVKNYKINYIEKNKDDLMSKVFLASKDIELPDAPLNENGSKDSLFLYYYYKNHFFDNIDFSDDRLLRSPVFHGKLKQYISSVVSQHPDSLMAECDMLVNKARANKEVLKYVIWYLTYYYETSKIMGYDAIFVHMVENYYMTKEAYWVNEKVLENITKRAMSLKPVLIGKKVSNLIMPDSSGRRMYSLYDIKAKYIILYFWDPDCGHCRTQTPALGKFYDENKSKGVEVFAININNSRAKEWMKSVKTYNLKFINVWDPQNQTNFRKTFDVFSSPVLFVLDSDFKIIGKKLSVEQLPNFIDRQTEYENKEKQK